MDHHHAKPEYAGAIHHLELNVADLDSSIDFWDWLLTELGYEPKNEFEGGRSWRKGPTYVVVVHAEEDGPFDGGVPGLNHVAFHAASRAQVDAITEEVRDREDAAVLFEDRHPYAGGYYALYCESPEGMKVEVVGPEE